MIINDKYYVDLIKDLKIVAYARFNKIRRLKRNNFLGLLSISVVSVSLIVLSIADKVYSLKKISLIPFIEPNMEIWFFGMLASIIILIISIALSTMKIDLEIERLNKSAVDLNEIRRKIEFNIAHRNYDNKILFEDYLKIINSDLINHDEIDYKLNKLQINDKDDNISYYRMHYIDQNLTSIFYSLITLLAFFSILSIISQVIFKC